MDMLHTTEVMAIFVIFCLFWPQIWLAWQCPFIPCNQKCLVWIGRPRIPTVISNDILAIFYRNALYEFIAILVPNLFAVVTVLVLCEQECHR